ncbi:MAG TPA: hypothetical protein VGR62_10145 [Candidatus Binatia bacterium]|nr:hypothetical protein [Candidatus Binatia bacterium]
MITWLRVLGVVVLLLGVVAAIVCSVQFVGDANYYEIVAAYERHPNHAIFQAEYWAAAGRHWALLVAAVAGLFVGLTTGSTLIALAEILRRLPPR